MVSHRKRKRDAQARGLTGAELELCELLAEVIELLRWNQVLGYSNQYLLHEKLAVTQDERKAVLQAAANAVEQDGRIQDWSQRLLGVELALRRIHADMQAGSTRPAAPPPQTEAVDGG